MVVETSGDRMEPSRYEVIVKGKQVSAMSRNGTTLQVGAAMSYSVEELFHVLDQELDLQKNPQRMGAPPGYASYPMASFDPINGRLLRFQRSVGGTKNSIEIIVPEFEALDP